VSGTEEALVLENQELLQIRTERWDRGHVEQRCDYAYPIPSVCAKASPGVSFLTEEEWLRGRFSCRGSGSRIRFLYLGPAFATLRGYAGLPLLAGGWLCMSVPPEEEDAVVSQTGTGWAACPGRPLSRQQAQGRGALPRGPP